MTNDSVPTVIVYMAPQEINDLHSCHFDYFDYLEALHVVSSTAKELEMSAYCIMHEYDVISKIMSEEYDMYSYCESH